MIAEPIVVTPEAVFEAAIVEAVHHLVGEVSCRCVVVPKFGLDIALFLQDDGGAYARFLEAKVYAAGRPGGVGFGAPNGRGPQVEILLCSEENLAVLDNAVRWVFADATRAPGSPRYAFVDCRRARAAAMGQVAKGKQNNFRVSALADSFVTWPDLVAELRQFLFAPWCVPNKPAQSALAAKPNDKREPVRSRRRG